LREQGALFLILATGRRLAQVLHGFAHEGLPTADAVISQVGTEIYLPPFKADMAPLAAWDERLRRSFSRRRALAFVQGIEGARLQPDMYNTPLKVSFYLDQAPDADGAAEAVRQRIAAAGAADDYRLVWSSGRDLDIIPAMAGKANAVRYLLRFLEMDAENVVTAGDSGNDLSMLTAFPRGVVVGNAQRELQQLRDAGHDGLFFATADYAGGVAQGLRHFGVLRTAHDNEGEA
jgi:sucrose-6F-phosphate phosphohydrolase